MSENLTIQLRQVSASTSEAEIRTHTVFVDRPAEKGGSDLGPMGGELFLASVGGCFLSTLLAAIRAREAGVSGIRAEVVGELAQSPTRFSAVRISVQADTGGRELLESLVAIAERGCIMTNTLRGKLNVEVQVAD